MNNNKKFEGMSEEDFLKNKARRKGNSVKLSAKGGSKKSKKQKKSPWAGILIALASVIVLLGLVVLIPFGIFKFIAASDPDNHENVTDNFVNSEGETVNRATSEKGNKKYFTFLATATDVGGSLTDVIMVARFHYDDKEPNVSILQIPRDTYVKMSTGKLYFNSDGTLSNENFIAPTANSSVKINEVYYRGKNLAEESITALLEEVSGKNESEIKTILEKKDYIFLNADIEKVKKYASSTDTAEKKQLDKNIRRDFGIKYLQTLIYYDFGIPTDYHAQVNINGFRGVVDAIGGVDLYVPQNMDYEDEYQDLYIHLKKGQQHLNGKKAEEFVRFRGYPGGDVARLDAQKIFVDAFLDKLLSFSTITKLDDIVSEIQKNLYTNISFNNMVKFADKVLLMDIKEDISIQTLPGMGEYIGAASYYVADRDATIALVNQEFNVFDTELIDEDFCIIASEDIVRPAYSYDPSDETDDEANGESDDEADNETSEDDTSEDDTTDIEVSEDDEDAEDNQDKSKDSDDSNNREDSEETGGDAVDNEKADAPNDSEGEDKGDDSHETANDSGSNDNPDTETAGDNSSDDSPTNAEEPDENLQLLEGLVA